MVLEKEFFILFFQNTKPFIFVKSIFKFYNKRKKKQFMRCTHILENGNRCKLNTKRGYLCWIHGITDQNLKVGPSQIAGFGLFARNKIKNLDEREVIFRRNDVIVDYEGIILNTQAEKDLAEQEGRDEYWLEIKDSIAVIDASDINSGFGRFSNDCRPVRRNCNARFLGRQIVATKNIKNGQEILTPYGEAYWQEAQRQKNKR
jgi:hypothetical protein